MLTCNGDAARQEEIHFKSCPPRSSSLWQRGAESCGAARALPAWGQRLQTAGLGTLRGGLLFPLFHGAKPGPVPAAPALPWEQGGHGPHTSPPLWELHAPLQLQNKPASLAKSSALRKEQNNGQVLFSGPRSGNGGAGAAELGRGAQRRAQPTASTRRGNQDTATHASAFKSLSFHRNKLKKPKSNNIPQT